MNIEEQLKEAILSTYKSVRAFSVEADIPYTTVVSMLERGIKKANVENVLKICNALNIASDSLSTDSIRYKTEEENNSIYSTQITALVYKFCKLSTEGKAKAVQYVDDLLATTTYNAEYLKEFAKAKRHALYAAANGDDSNLGEVKALFDGAADKSDDN